MNERGIQFNQVIELFWERREKFIKLNPSGMVPFIMCKPDIMIFDSQVIIEFLEEQHTESKSLIYGTPKERALIRQIIKWFDEKTYRDSTEHILRERMFNFFQSNSEPDHAILKVARANLVQHMKYLQNIIPKSGFLAGDEFSAADLSVAAHISSLDYLGEINWDHYPVAKEWYVIIKSRPSFREVLCDTISGFRPAQHYRELDF